MVRPALPAMVLPPVPRSSGHPTRYLSMLREIYLLRILIISVSVRSIHPALSVLWPELARVALQGTALPQQLPSYLIHLLRWRMPLGIYTYQIRAITKYERSILQVSFLQLPEQAQGGIR